MRTSTLFLLLTLVAETACGQSAVFLRKIDWVGQGVWLQADTHIHTRFSDGSFPLSRVVDEAVKNGCRVIGITDHADKNLQAATPVYQAAIEEARRKHPQHIILAGLEWNVPPWGGNEHATVLVPPGQREWATLAAFKARFDDLGRKQHFASLADEAFRWIANQKSITGAAPVVMFNHVSRKREQLQSFAKDVRWWNAISLQSFVGFSGAPGHQLSAQNGNYKWKIKTIDRWDPIVAKIGGVWDTLLQQDLDIWAARAPSDFHNFTWDYWPGQFSQTWLYARSATPDAALEAFRAGSFFAVHGRIVDRVELSVMADGLPRPAISGESIRVRLGAPLRVQLSFRAPKVDWEGRPNQLDEIELIGITKSSVTSLLKRSLRSGEKAVVHRMAVPAGGIVIRARGRRRVINSPDLLFYTNPVRIKP